MSADRIEFRCETCGKLLRAPVSKAGATSECPQCGDAVRVPTDGGLLGTFTPPGEVRCPVCGATADANAPACPACGELLGGLEEHDPTGMGRGGPVEVTLGSVWNSAVETWKEHLGILLAGILLAGLVVFAVAFSLYVGMIGVTLAAAALTGGGPGGPNDALMATAMILFGLLYAAGTTAASSWMTLGLANLHLEAVRGRPELGTLFRTGGFWRILLCGLILTFCGYALSIAPMFGVMYLLFEGMGGGPPGGWGILGMFAAMYLVPVAVFGGLFVLFWPAAFLCADRPDVGHVKPLWFALKLPSGQWGGHVAVGLAAYGLFFAASLFTCGIGGLFAGPLAGLLLAHAYDRYDRAEVDARGPRMLDPEGVI